MVRLLHVISTVDPRTGGPIELIRQFHQPLLERGVESTVVCCDSAGDSWLPDSSLPPIVALGPARLRFAYAANLLSWLRANHDKYDLVLVHGLWQYHGLAVRRALAGTSTPYFVYAHGMLDPWFKHTYPAKHVKKLVYWFLAERKNLSDAKAVLFTTEEEQHLARQSFPSYRVNEMVCGPGLRGAPMLDETGLRNFYENYPEVEGRRVILFLGRIHEKKGVDLLIRAFAELSRIQSEIHLMIVGPSSTTYLERLKSLTTQLDISSRVTWVDMLSGSQKWSAFRASEIFCLPSHQENFGLVVAEALSAGKPVLISNKVNLWREVERCGAGLVSEDTVEGTLVNLSKWFDLDLGEQRRMVLSSKRCFDECFSIERATDRLVEALGVLHN